MSSGGRILVVEDDGIIAFDIQRQLRSFGYVVAGTFSDAESALTEIQHLQIDLVLLDIELAGEMDGLQAAALIREQHHLPVILLTAYSDDRTIERAKDSVPYAYITKPFETRQLRTQIELALHRHHVEQRLAEREIELRRTQKLELLGRITGSVAHDFNNLLTVVLGHSRLIAKETASQPNNAEILRSLAGIRSAVNKSAGLTRQLLAFTRRRPLKARSVELQCVVDEIKPILQGIAMEGVGLRISDDDSHTRVMIDPALVEQIVMNLVLNARDAMPQGGTLTLRCYRKNQVHDTESRLGAVEPAMYAVLAVEDTGTGIPAEILDHIFDPFFSTKAEDEGVGLGLSTVLDIVRQLQGHVFVESEEGVGTRFELWFPVSDAPLAEETKSETAILDCAPGHERVLLVLEEQYLRELLVTTLTDLGYEVLECRNAGEALLRIEESSHQIDIAVLDSALRHVSVDRFIDRVRRTDPGLRVLLAGAPPAAAEGHPSIAKPFELEELCSRLRELLDDNHR